MKITKRQLIKIIKEAYMGDDDFDQMRVEREKESVFAAAVDRVKRIVHQAGGVISPEQLIGTARRDPVTRTFNLNDLLDELQETGLLEWDDESSQWVTLGQLP